MGTRPIRHVLTSLAVLAALAVLGAAAAGCSSTDASTGTDLASQGDAPGEMARDNFDRPSEIVRISNIDRAQLRTSGTVRYYLQNVTDQNQEDLVYSVMFVYPPSKGGSIEMMQDSDVTPETEFVLARGEKAAEITAVSPLFAQRHAAGQDPITTRIYVNEQLPVRPVERRAGEPGTKFMNGALEIVGLSSEDALRSHPPALWLELENVSGSPLPLLEVKVIFVDVRDNRVSETKWQPLPQVAPGSRVRKDVNLAGVTPSTGGFLVKIRPSPL